jgi:hypothetical protein
MTSQLYDDKGSHAKVWLSGLSQTQAGKLLGIKAHVRLLPTIVTKSRVIPSLNVVIWPPGLKPPRKRWYHMGLQ